MANLPANSSNSIDINILPNITLLATPLLNKTSVYLLILLVLVFFDI